MSETTMNDPERNDAAPSNMASAKAEDFLDEVLPEGLEWKHLVTTYPRASLTAAFVGGVVLGRVHGLGLVAAVSGFVAGEVTRNVQGLVEDWTDL